MDFVLHMQGIHYMAHWTNLAMQTLFKLNMVNRLENLLQTLYAYFNMRLRMHLALSKLVEIMEFRVIGFWKILKQGGFLCWNL